MEAYSLRGVDRFIATQGRQNLTFSFTGPEMQQRIDRFHYLADFWDFADLTLQPLDYSIVVHGGDDGWACYTKGNNQIFIPPDVPWGYANGILVAWHIFQMQKMSPLLLSAVMCRLYSWS